VSGRRRIQAEIRKRLAGIVNSVSITPWRDYIISYLHGRLDEDTIPDAMEKNLEADILKGIPKNISEMSIQALALGGLL